MIICECGEIIYGSTFRDYIRTSANPSTPTIGHEKCGHIFNFIDAGMPRKYSSRKELKSLAMRFADMNKLKQESIGNFLVEVDRMKSSGSLSDNEILMKAFQKVRE